MSDPPVLEEHKLKHIIKQLFFKAGTREDEAEVLADSLVYANLTGVDSHGVVRVPVYLDRLEKGLVKGAATPEWVVDFGAVAVLDGDNGWGQVAAQRAMDRAIQKALQFGVGIVAVRNTNHIGACAYWTKRATQQACIGFASTNAAPVMAAYGTSRPTLGTNPLSIAVPTCADGASPPMVLDMATSEVARGKIIVKEQLGEPIPYGWGIDADGRPTTNPRDALRGALLPFGGVKGSGLAIMMDVLSGVLSGANFGLQVGDLYGETEQGLGCIFGAIHVGAFMEPSVFMSRMQERIRMTKEAKSPTVKEALVPGEMEERVFARRKTEGIPVDPTTMAALEKLMQKYHV